MQFDPMQDIDIIFHLHIPKCAGTSLRTSIFQSLPDHECIEWNSTNPYDLDISIDEFAATLSRHPNTRIVSGHFPYGIHSILKGKSFKYITILRNPIDRILSNYRHMLTENLYLIPPEEAELIVRGGPSTYIRSKYAKITFLNTQARLISGMLKDEQLYATCVPDFLNTCLDTISRDFIHVGLQADFPKTLAFLNKLLKLPPNRMLVENTNNARGNNSHISILPQREIDYLSLANSYDFALLDKLFGRVNACPKSSSVTSLDKQRYIYSVLCDSVLNLSNMLRVVKAECDSASSNSQVN